MIRQQKQLVLILAVLFAVVLLDQGSKALVGHLIEQGPENHIGKGTTFFYFVHERNPGLVLGMFGGSPLVVKIAPLVATGVLIYLYRHVEPASFWQAAAFGMISGGAIGNLIDRFFRGTVVDFLQFNFYFLPDFIGLPTKKYPAFNLADSAICIGVGLLILSWHRMGRKGEAGDAADSV